MLSLNLFMSVGLSEDIRTKWDAFVAGSLAEVNKRNTIELVRYIKDLKMVIITFHVKVM